jgi:EpsI family protein
MKRAAPYIICGLLITEMAALHFFGNVVFVETPGVHTKLPDRIAGYTAIDYVYCQSDQCLASTRVAVDADAPRTCPACDGPVDDVTLAEKTLLPAGTHIIKRSYESPGRAPVHVSIVIAGDERRSIHKPQVCLRGQGFTIRDQHVERIRIDKNRQFAAMFLDATRRPQGNGPSTSYAYWFASKIRETPHHLVRLFWIAVDGAVFGKRYTWAYVAVSSDARKSNRAHSTVKEFLKELYPLIAMDIHINSPTPPGLSFTN